VRGSLCNISERSLPGKHFVWRSADGLQSSRKRDGASSINGTPTSEHCIRQNAARLFSWRVLGSKRFLRTATARMRSFHVHGDSSSSSSSSRTRSLTSYRFIGRSAAWLHGWRVRYSTSCTSS
jgi:hypothetical protein